MRLPVVPRAQLAAWREHARRVRSRSGRTLTSVLLVVGGLAGALGFASLLGAVVRRPGGDGGVGGRGVGGPEP